MPSHTIISVQSLADGVSWQVNTDQYDDCRYQVKINATTTVARHTQYLSEFLVFQQYNVYMHRARDVRQSTFLLPVTAPSIHRLKKYSFTGKFGNKFV